MTEQQKLKAIQDRIKEYKKGIGIGMMLPASCIDDIESILSPLPHQDGASAEEVLNKMVSEMPWVLSDNVRPYIIEALNVFAQSETAKVVAEKEREIKQIRAEALEIHADLVEANARIAHLESGMAEWVKIANERQFEINRLEAQINSVKSNPVTK